MEYISSDTNVWLDFAIIDRLAIPFRLPYRYLMNCEAIQEELLAPKGLGEQLVEFGLEPIELTGEEFFLADEYRGRFKQLSVHDCVALAVAKCRKIILMTGDRALRNAAESEKVSVMGTIGVLDQAYIGKYIDVAEYLECLEKLEAHNGEKIRLPSKEIEKRIEKIKGKRIPTSKS